VRKGFAKNAKKIGYGICETALAVDESLEDRESRQISGLLPGGRVSREPRAVAVS
jgi:hypothetical protein